MDDNLKVLFPDKDIEIGGEQFVLRPYSFGKLPKVIGNLGEILHLITSTPPNILALIGNTSSWKEHPEVLQYLASMLQVGGDNIMNLMGLAVNKPREWVDELPPDDGMRLFLETLEINIDFFQKRFEPAMNQMSGRARSISDQLKPEEVKTAIPAVTTGEELSEN